MSDGGFDAEKAIVDPLTAIMRLAGLPVEQAGFVACQAYRAVIEGVLLSPLTVNELYVRGLSGL